MNVPKPKSTWRMLAALLPLLITACASPPTISASACPTPPQKPPELQPQPPQSYSASAAANIDKWQAQLMATLPTAGNADPDGRGE